MSITTRKNRDGKIVYDNAFMYNGVRYKKRGFKSKGEAENWEINVKYEINKNGSYSHECKKSFADVYKEWLDLNEDKYSINTLSSYQCAFKKIKSDKIAKMRIVNIRYQIIQEYFNRLGNEYKNGTCRNVYKVFNLTFKHAMRNGYIETNPMVYVECKGKKDNKKNDDKTISYENFQIICEEFMRYNDSFNNQALVVALQIGYYTGARATEVLALSKDDVDFNRNTITFNKRLECRKKGSRSYVAPMKTESSYATLPLAKPLKDILIDWFAINPYENICVYDDGEYIEYGWLQAKIKRASKKTGIPFHFHMLRHTLATNLVMKNVSPAIAKNLLRHSTIKTTMDIYTHIQMNDEQKALDMLFISNNNSELPQNYPKMQKKVN